MNSFFEKFLENRFWVNVGGVLFFLILGIMVFSSGLASPEGRQFTWVLTAVFGAWGCVQLLHKLPSWSKNRLQYGILVVSFFVVLWSYVYLLPPSYLGNNWVLKGVQPTLNDVVPAALAWDQEAAALGFSQLIASFFFLVGCTALARNEYGRFQLFWGVLAVALVQGVLGLFTQNFGGSRTIGVLVNPNHHAASLFMGIPLLIAWLKESGRRSQERILLPVERDFTGICYVLLFLLGISWLTTFSRTSLLMGWIALTAWGVWEILGKAHFKVVEPEDSSRRAGLLNKFLLLGAVSGLMIIAIQLFVDSGRGRAINQSEDVLSRFSYWKASFQGLQETNFFGMGIGGSRYAINRYITDFALPSEPVFTHNDLLQWICDLGIVGGVFLLLLWVLFAGILYQAFKKDWSSHGRWRERRIWRAILVAFIVTWLHALTDFHLRVPLVSFQLIAIFALLSSLPRIRCADLFMNMR